MPPLSFLFPPRSIASTKTCRLRSEPRISNIGLPVLLPAMFLQIAKNRQNVLRRPAGQQHYAETKAWQGGRRDERQ
ncbi:hypothetical protein BU17DRAFT_93073 [Hysterangium stoloniferum]|nr:hypothetical protein BU17DRAFT_93073 [Hysterangium stoloniferum]